MSRLESPRRGNVGAAGTVGSGQPIPAASSGAQNQQPLPVSSTPLPEPEPASGYDLSRSSSPLLATLGRQIGEARGALKAGTLAAVMATARECVKEGALQSAGAEELNHASDELQRFLIDVVDNIELLELGNCTLDGIQGIFDGLGVFAKPQDQRIFQNDRLIDSTGSGALATLAAALLASINPGKMQAARPGSVLSAMNCFRRCLNIGVAIDAKEVIRMTRDFLSMANKPAFTQSLTLKQVGKCFVQLQGAMTRLEGLTSASKEGKAIEGIVRRLCECDAFKRMTGLEDVGVVATRAVLPVCVINVANCLLAGIEKRLLPSITDGTVSLAATKLRNATGRWTEQEIESSDTRAFACMQANRLGEIVKAAQQGTSSSTVEVPGSAASPDASAAAADSPKKTADAPKGSRRAGTTPGTGTAKGKAKGDGADLRAWIDGLRTASASGISALLSAKGASLSRLLEQPDAHSPCALVVLFTEGRGKILQKIAAHHDFSNLVTKSDQLRFIQALKAMFDAMEEPDVAAQVEINSKDLQTWLKAVEANFDPVADADVWMHVDRLYKRLEPGSASSQIARARATADGGGWGIAEISDAQQRQHDALSGLMKLDMSTLAGQKKLWDVFQSHRDDVLGEKILGLVVSTKGEGYVALRDRLPACKTSREVGAIFEALEVKGGVRPGEKLLLRYPTVDEERKAYAAYTQVASDDAGLSREKRAVWGMRAAWLSPAALLGGILGTADSTGSSVVLAHSQLVKAWGSLNKDGRMWRALIAEVISGEQAAGREPSSALVKALHELVDHVQKHPDIFFPRRAETFDEQLALDAKTLKIFAIVFSVLLIAVAISRKSGSHGGAPTRVSPARRKAAPLVLPEVTRLEPPNAPRPMARVKTWLALPEAIRTANELREERRAAVKTSRLARPGVRTGVEFGVTVVALYGLGYVSAMLLSRPTSGDGLVETVEHFHSVLGTIVKELKPETIAPESFYAGMKNLHDVLGRDPANTYFAADPATVASVGYVVVASGAVHNLLYALAAALLIYMYLHRADILYAFAPGRAPR